MSCLVNTLFIIISVLFMCTNKIYSISEHPLLFVISFDGFRYNYFDRNLTSELVKLRSNGTYSEYMTSVFPSKTFPNHFSIATGMFADVHGVLDNKVFDSKLNKELKNSFELFHYSEEITPIWTLNERKGGGRHSGCMMWPGSEYAYQGLKPKFYQSYNESITWEEKVDQIISWYVDKDNPINLGMMYFEQPDLIMHSYGPDSPQVNKELEHVNSIVKYLMGKIMEANLSGKLNVIMLSDHGAQAVPFTHVIDLNKFLDNSTYSYYGVSPNLQIYPKAGKYDEVLSLLRKGQDKYKNFTVYTKDDIPERWNYKENDRCPPIFIVADDSYAFNDLLKDEDVLKVLSQTKDLSNVTFGTHGYDPLHENMRAFFMAFGPSVKRNHTIPPFTNVDLYPLFTKLLDLELPAVKPNGTLSSVQEILEITKRWSKNNEEFESCGNKLYGEEEPKSNLLFERFGNTTRASSYETAGVVEKQVVDLALGLCTCP